MDSDLESSLRALRRLNEAAKLRWDSGELLFEHESREVFEKGDEQESRLKSLREDLYKRAGRPDAPYYALIKADGDSMGKTLSGLGIEEHVAFSRSMTDFSIRVHSRLRELDCMPVFAGGDDVLAVLPLHRLREAAWMVRKEFRSVGGGSERITLSAGIAIAHALEPLDEVRDRAERALRAAKDEPGKDSIAIEVCPRSGAAVQATGNWVPIGEALEEITCALREDRLSFGFAHELRALLDRTLGYSELEDILPQMAIALARKKGKEESAAESLVEKAGGREDLDALTNRILVARKMARAERDAGIGEELPS